MPTLHELQAGVRAALLGDDESAAAALVRADGLDASARLAVYRHHVFSSLTAVLESTYPVVVRLVDPRFFRYAAHRYIRDHPPTNPCLFEYGATLPEFLESFAPSRHLAYLPDVARLEWAMNAALHAPEPPPIQPEALARGDVGLHPSVTMLRSSWPVDSIWRANQPEADAVVADLTTGAVRLQIWRIGDEVAFRLLSRAGFAFRNALARTCRLGAGATAALAADPATDLAALIREVLEEGVLV